MCAALAEQDIAVLFHFLQHHGGLSQRQVAELTGRTLSKIHEILHGRKVTSYRLLLRIVQSLGIPRGRLGLAYDRPVPPGAHSQHSSQATAHEPRDVT